MGYTYALTAAIIWGSGGLFIKRLNADGMTALSILILRGIIVAALICICLLFRPSLFRIDRKDIPLMAIAGVNLVACCQGLFIYSMTLTGMALTTILYYTAPAFVIVISCFVFKEPITVHKTMALLCSFVGLILVVGLLNGSLNASPVALIAGTASGLGYALHTIFFKHLVKKYSSLTANFWAILFGVGITGVVALPIGGLTLPQTGETWFYLFLLSLGPGFLSFHLFASSLKYIEAGRASIITAIEPVSAAIFGYVFLTEMIVESQILGMALVILGSVLSSVKSATRRTQIEFTPTNID